MNTRPYLVVNFGGTLLLPAGRGESQTAIETECGHGIDDSYLLFWQPAANGVTAQSPGAHVAVGERILTRIKDPGALAEFNPEVYGYSGPPTTHRGGGVGYPIFRHAWHINFGRRH